MAKQLLEIPVYMPEGWVWTGEYHRAFKGNGYLTNGQALVWSSDIPSGSEYPIIRRVEPVRESRWRRVPDADDRSESRLWGSREQAGICRGCRVERLDYENGKCVSVTLEPAEGER